MFIISIKKGVYIMRINLNIPDELVKTIDKKAKSLNLNRTAYVVMTLSRYFQQEDLMDTFPEFVKMVKAEQARKEQAKQLAE